MQLNFSRWTDVGTLKTELIRHYVHPTRAAATAAIADYIVSFHSPQREHSQRLFAHLLGKEESAELMKRLGASSYFSAFQASATFCSR